jgi:hypothetical protein
MLRPISLADTAAWVPWTPGGKFGNPAGLGDLILQEGELSPSSAGILGELHGRVLWEGTDRGIPEARVRIQSLSSGEGERWTAADQQGHFAVKLPPGRYQVQLHWPGRSKAQDVVAELEAGSTAEVDLVAPPPEGERLPVGPGRGHWQTFGQVDGLVSQTVYAIHQDQKGIMWFGTEGGISRYDGRQFRSFTKQNGLEDNWVWCILEDREGNMWFGTRVGGVTRYDGEKFESFTIKNGLASNEVTAMLQDRHGNLWFATNSDGVSRYNGWFATPIFYAFSAGQPGVYLVRDYAL